MYVHLALQKGSHRCIVWHFQLCIGWCKLKLSFFFSHPYVHKFVWLAADSSMQLALLLCQLCWRVALRKAKQDWNDPMRKFEDDEVWKTVLRFNFKFLYLTRCHQLLYQCISSVWFAFHVLKFQSSKPVGVRISSAAGDSTGSQKNKGYWKAEMSTPTLAESIRSLVDGLMKVQLGFLDLIDSTGTCHYSVVPRDLVTENIRIKTDWVCSFNEIIWVFPKIMVPPNHPFQ